MDSTRTEPDNINSLSDPFPCNGCFGSDPIKPCRQISPGPPPPPSASPSPKRSRGRSAAKRVVVSIPVSEADVSRARGVADCAPPSDSWAWRKYGQKPIKGSPYPRGYYRCSSSKGCPARKRVERSRADPTMLLVTYTCDHNHNTSCTNKRAAAVKEHQLSDPATQTPHESAADPAAERSKFTDLIEADDFWQPDVGSTPSTSPPGDTLLYGSIFVVGCGAELAPEEGDGGKIGDADVDSALFEGLEELPEYSIVFRRSYWERRPLSVHTAVHQ